MPHLVVAGASAALAKPLILCYLEAGWEVTGLYREKTPILEAHPRLTLVGGLNLRHSWAAARIGELPEIDLLVTLTGSVSNGKLVDLRAPAWERVLGDTLTAVFQTLCHGLPRIRAGGSVVVVGSVVGRAGGYGCGNYAAAKAGLVGLVRSAANEHAARGVRVNLLELGYTELGMGAELPATVAEAVKKTIPLRRFARAEEFVAAIVFLEKAYMTGGVLPLAGGL